MLCHSANPVFRESPRVHGLHGQIHGWKSAKNVHWRHPWIFQWSGTCCASSTRNRALDGKGVKWRCFQRPIAQICCGSGSGIKHYFYFYWPGAIWAQELVLSWVQDQFPFPALSSLWLQILHKCSVLSVFQAKQNLGGELWISKSSSPMSMETSEFLVTFQCISANGWYSASEHIKNLKNH